VRRKRKVQSQENPSQVVQRKIKVLSPSQENPRKKISLVKDLVKVKEKEETNVVEVKSNLVQKVP